LKFRLTRTTAVAVLALFERMLTTSQCQKPRPDRKVTAKPFGPLGSARRREMGDDCPAKAETDVL
jgi:hypothetical protein